MLNNCDFNTVQNDNKEKNYNKIHPDDQWKYN